MTPDAVHALAGKVEREWGSYGYSFEEIMPLNGGAVARVAHFDGSRFYVAADRHGNTAHGDTQHAAAAALFDSTSTAVGA